MRVFRRDGFACKNCGRRGQLDCDHVTAISEGGSWWSMDNLQTLCKYPCHRDKSIREARRRVHPEKLAWREYLAARVVS